MEKRNKKIKITSRIKEENDSVTFVMLTDGNEIPIKYPNKAPMVTDIISLIVSFGFLRNLLKIRIH